MNVSKPEKKTFSEVEAERDSAIEKLAEMTERHENRGRRMAGHAERTFRMVEEAVSNRDALAVQAAILKRELGAARVKNDLLKADLEEARADVARAEQWAEDRVAKLEADIAARSERAVETSSIADGGRYTTLNERIVSNQIRLDEGVFNQNPASFSAVSYSGKHANMFCARLNRERDGRIAAEAELAALKAQQANGSETPNGSADATRCLGHYNILTAPGAWHIRAGEESIGFTMDKDCAVNVVASLKELDAARVAAEKRAKEAEAELAALKSDRDDHKFWATAAEIRSQAADSSIEELKEELAYLNEEYGALIREKSELSHLLASCEEKCRMEADLRLQIANRCASEQRKANEHRNARADAESERDALKDRVAELEAIAKDRIPDLESIAFVVADALSRTNPERSDLDSMRKFAKCSADYIRELPISESDRMDRI